MDQSFAVWSYVFISEKRVDGQKLRYKSILFAISAILYLLCECTWKVWSLAVRLIRQKSLLKWITNALEQEQAAEQVLGILEQPCHVY